MKCARCQHENEAGAKFCEECAAPLAGGCAKCGRPLSPTAKFCPECAHPTSLSAAPQAQRFDSPESYTPKHLAEKILTSKTALEGERKLVTVLFADLKGSMELLADRDPEEARKLLDPVLEHMMEAVHRYEGTVNQVMGDGIMALFGAPVAHEDHAVRACYAALRMQTSLQRYAEAVRREHGVTMRIRVGLNSGEVVVRAIGSDLRMDYTAVGQTTHLAARMEQLADPGSILLTPDTLAPAEGFVRVTALGPMALKGVPAPVDVYELVGVSAVRSRLQAAAARGLSRFVGRDAEIDQLRRALVQAHQGRGQVVAVVGEPGVGKSRLAFELTHSHRVDGWLVLESGSVSYGKATSYLPVIDLLKAYFKIDDRDTYREIREKATGKILTLDPGLEPALPALLNLLDVPIEDPDWSTLDPSQRRQRTLDAIKRLLMREAELQPLVLVFEDLHWVDSETQVLLDNLVESLPTARVLLLVSYRPEYSHGWSRKTYYLQLRLDPLPPESTDELLDALLGPDASLQPLKTRLAASTGGNPLFLEESVRALVELNALVGERGACRLAQPIDTLSVPATVQSILAARIDRLPPEEKRLLESAAAIGKDFAYTLLQVVTGDTDQALRPRLEHLQAAEFLYETRLFPDLEYTFKHALTHDVTYGSLLHERRRALHARVVAAIAHLHGDRLAEHVERLAHHAFRGEDWGRAVQWGRQAAAKALTRSANREATVYLKQALEALPRLPDSRETRELAVDLRLDLYGSLMPLDDLRPLLQFLREAEALAVALDDQERLGWARLYICHLLLLIDDPRAAVRLGHDVVGIAEAVGNRGIEADAYLWLGCGYYALGQHRRAVELLRKGVAARRIYKGSRDVVALSGYVVMFLAELGEFAEAAAAAENTTGSALTTPDRPFNVSNACWQIASFWCLQGDLDRATSLAERAVDLSRRWSFTRSLGNQLSLYGHILALSGHATRAVEVLEQGMRQADAFGHMWLRCQRLHYLAEGYLLAGRPDEAKRTADQALELARVREERGFEAWALRLQAEIAATTTPIGEVAETRYREAMTLATELEMRPLVAHCHLGLGTLYCRKGERLKADEHLTAAKTMYREMGMNFWLKKAEAGWVP
jgi:class 3 adenylate cyclase/tetratricopeptide (TPR) repeat protein